MQDDDRMYHSAAGYVYAAGWAIELSALWDAVDEIVERTDIPLGQIGLALQHNRSAAIIAIAFKNVACLRALIAEAKSIAS